MLMQQLVCDCYDNFWFNCRRCDNCISIGHISSTFDNYYIDGNKDEVDHA